MPEDVQPVRNSQKLEERIKILEEKVKVLFEALKAQEEETGDEYVKAGEHFGVKFD